MYFNGQKEYLTFVTTYNAEVMQETFINNCSLAPRQHIYKKTLRATRQPPIQIFKYMHKAILIT